MYSTNTTTALSLTAGNYGFCFVNETAIRTAPNRNQLAFFDLGSDDLIHPLCVVYKKGTDLSLPDGLLSTLQPNFTVLPEIKSMKNKYTDFGHSDFMATGIIKLPEAHEPNEPFGMAFLEAAPALFRNHKRLLYRESGFSLPR